MERHYAYVIKVDEKEVWRGKKPKAKYFELKKQNPSKRVSIAWESDEDIVIVLVG